MTSTKPPSCSSSCDDDATDSPVDGARRRLLGGAAAAGVLGALPFDAFAGCHKRADPGRYDALLHLGDYIYESSADGYGSDHAKALGRVVEPLHETLTIHDYRRRYAQCREDTDLQRLHQLAPMIAIWDDHEFANNAWRDGAENRQETEGTFKRRRAVAARAWREWLPVRDTVSETEEAKRLVIRHRTG